MAVHNTTVQFLANTGITDEHKPYFENAAARDSYFASLAVRAEGVLSYQRENLYFRAQSAYDTIANCDYIRYQNNPFTNKWYYGRIISKEWISENSTHVVFEIDYFITYMFDFSLNSCFVEREMVNGDWNGDIPSYNNLVPEGTELEEYVQQSEYTYSFGPWRIVIAYGADVNGKPVGGEISNSGVYSGVKYNIYSNEESANAFISTYNDLGVGESILAVFQVPLLVYTESEITATIPFPNSWVGGYTPKNGKCFSSPYCLIKVESPNGAFEYYNFEDFNSPNEASFTGQPSFGMYSAIRFIPNLYKGAYMWHEQSVVWDNFPQCAWISNSFANWFAQNAGATITTIGLSAATAVGGALSGNIPAAIGGTVAAGRSIARISDQSVNQTQKNGAFSNGTANITWGRNAFKVRVLMVRSDAIQRIDDYFTAFGYRTNKLKIPNIRTRPYWNFVKTSNCVIKGSCPDIAIKYIKDMFNNGVTLWHIDKGATIGNYTLDNRG